MACLYKSCCHGERWGSCVNRQNLTDACKEPLSVPTMELVGEGFCVFASLRFAEM